MSTLYRLLTPDRGAARVLNALQPLLALFARCYVSWQFLKAGYLKITSWDNTLYLFENEYHTPVLSPMMAAISGTFGELVFPSLLVIGLAGRLSALGLFVVNLMAVVSYSSFLLAEGHEAALGQHVLWGSIIAYLAIHGPGRYSFDYWIDRKAK